MGESGSDNGNNDWIMDKINGVYTEEVMFWPIVAVLCFKIPTIWNNLFNLVNLQDEEITTIQIPSKFIVKTMD